MLDTQYRMHPIIARFSSEKFYNNKLKDGVESKDRPTPSGFPWPSKEAPLSFVNIKGKEVKEKESICNLEEGNQVKNILKKLIEVCLVLFFFLQIEWNFGRKRYWSGYSLFSTSRKYQESSFTQWRNERRRSILWN